MAGVVRVDVQNDEARRSSVDDVAFSVAFFGGKVAENTPLVPGGCNVIHSPCRKEVIHKYSSTLKFIANLNVAYHTGPMARFFFFTCKAATSFLIGASKWHDVA